MNKSINGFLMVLLLSVCNGCQQETMLESENEELSEIEVSFGNRGITSRMTGSEWEDKDAIGVFMTYSGQKLSSASIIGDATNRRFNYERDQDGFIPTSESDRLYYPIKAAVDFTAYYPYAYVNDFSIDWDISRQQDPSSIDLLYSDNLKNISATKDKQALLFAHQLCKLIFHIQKGESVSEDELTNLQIILEDVPTRAAFSLVDNSWTLNQNSQSDIHTTVDDALGQMLVYPGECKGKKVTVISDSQTYSFQIAADEAPWTQGLCYDYKLTLEKNGVAAELEATIQPWPTEEDRGEIGGDDSHSAASVWDGYTYDTTWYDETSSSFTVNSASQLCGLAQLVSKGNTFKDKVINLTKDCNLANHSLMPIGLDDTHSFEGTFNGDGHTISEIAASCTEAQPYAALFGVNKGVIRNVITTGTITVKSNIGKTYVAGLVALNQGTVEDCRSYMKLDVTVNAALANTTNLYVGGLVAVNESTTSGCKNYATLVSQHTNTGKAEADNTYIGGVVGQNKYGVITGCSNYQSLSSKGDCLYMGGVCGYMAGAEEGKPQARLESCVNYGDVIGEGADNDAYIGGVVGCTGKNTTSLSAGENYGKVQAVGVQKGIIVSAGGVLGRATQCKVTSCVNKGEVIVANTLDLQSTTLYGGGLIGMMENSSELHTSRQQAGQEVQVASGICGGLVGYLKIEETSESKVYGCNVNSGLPLKWIGSEKENGYQAGVTQTEHED